MTQHPSTATAELVCAGRQLDDQLQPVGDPCGRRSGTANADVAAAAGWLVAPDGTATCPACRRPPPEVAALVREVSRR